ncbi:MAG: DUF2059 domain-containing protein [Rhodomicrobium sp.]|nr:DUF2059 domain-containing protein [Rhodomicrobium sp.]
MISFTRLFILGLFLMSPLPASALEDSPRNREQEANRYLQAVPPESMMAGIPKRLAATLPPAQQEKFIRMMTKNLDMARVTAAMRAAMMKTFTADELRALADFYGSPAGKSAMAKMKTYMAEVMPAAMKELEAALAKTQQEEGRAQ